MVFLVASDNVRFHAATDVVGQFGIFQGIDESDESIPLPQVSSSILAKVLAYCEHHKYDHPPSTGSNPQEPHTTDISEWDQKFMTVDQEMLFEVILAANYLDIKPLLDLGCECLKNMIKAKNPEEIRKLFNLVNAFTPEEEAQIRRENEWAEDR